MSLWKRACLHTVRKKGKTVLMLLILLVIATLILTCLAIWSATDTAALNVRRALKGGFTVNAGQSEDLLQEPAVAEILKIPGITSNYNLRNYFKAEYRGMNNSKLAIKTKGAAKPLSGYEHVGQIVSTTHSDQDVYFTESGFKLIKGRHINEKDKNVILVSSEFAKKNSLKLGDTIFLFDRNTQVKVKIVGIFKPTKTQDLNGMNSPDSLYENIGFTDNAAYSQLSFNDGSNHYRYGDFYVDDPAQLDAIIAKIKNISGMDFENCIFTKYDSDYQNAKTQLEALQHLVAMIMAIVIVISVILLAFILLLWIRNRIQEIGMLLAMGIGKGNIILQHITEMILIAVLAFGLSFGASLIIAQTVGDVLFKQTAAEDQIHTKNLTDGSSKEVENEKTFVLESVDINVSLSDLLLVYGIGAGIIVLSVVFASYPIVRLKPKEILTKLS